MEWRLNHVWYADIEDARTCECGHYPICEVCIVENEVNGTILEIGNCCVNQISTEFEALSRVFPALRAGRINPAIIDYAYKQGITNDWENGFLRDIYENKLKKKQKLTPKQDTKFKEIRLKIYKNIEISPRQRVKIFKKWQVAETGAQPTRKETSRWRND